MNQRVVRYIRSPGYNTKVDNLYGITVVYELDYTNNKVFASWSICEETNFSKKEGVARALVNNQKLSFPYKLVQTEKGLNFALEAVLDKVVRSGKSDYAGSNTRDHWLYSNIKGGLDAVHEVRKLFL